MNVLTIFMFLIQTTVSEYDKRVITSLNYSKSIVTPTVVNGKPAVEGQFPFLVSIKEPRQITQPGKSVWKNLCGGCIIDRNRVLTAAHCFEGDDFLYAKHPDSLRMVAGDLSTNMVHSGKTITTKEVQWRKLTKVLIHKHYNFPMHDIALALADEPWVFNKKVNLIKVAKKEADYSRSCMVAGYGRVGHRLRDTISPVLLVAEIFPMSRLRCSSVWEMNMNTFICTESAIADVGRGDSGGPLVCQRTGDPNEIKGVGVLAGLVSGKNFDKTTLFTRTSAYTGWLATDAANKLQLTGEVCLTIILLVLIYLLF